MGAHEIDNAMREKIKRIWREEGGTLEKGMIAKRFGLAPSTVSRILKGVKRKCDH